LVAYALEITNIDPIPYDLLFERFLNPERVSMPDIDIDFCFENRDKVIKYVTDHYGEDKVAQISTFGKMLARAVIRDVGRVLDIPYGEVDKIAKLVPARLGITLKEAIDEEPQLAQMMATDFRIKELMEHALKLEGLNRHASTHAAGVVISERPLVEYLPLCNGKDGESVTQFAMKSVESIGLIKFDFLGLKTLTVIHHAVGLVNKTLSADQQLEVDHIPMGDPKAFELLTKGETTGVFQLESSGMKELMINLKPSTFEDIIALVALYRPGPLGSGMVDDFIRRKHGQIPIRYDLPQLEPILKDTYGVIVYQEQVMKIAQVLANYTLGEADLLRRAMGKKIAAEMDQQRERFLSGTKENKIADDKANAIFDLMAMFAEYGFNKSHSAAYALVSYQTAYLKAHYPVQFMASLLTMDRAHSDKIVKNIAECREMKIEVVPPDINRSDLFFTVEGDTILFGLAAVKNVGEAALQSLLEDRAENGPYEGLLDLCNRVELKKVNRKVLESLINCGAFDTLNGHRSQYLAYLDEALEVGAKRQKERNSSQVNMFAMLDPNAGTEAEGSQPDHLPSIPEMADADLLQREKELLGFYLSGHPLEQWSKLLDAYTDAPLCEISEMADKSYVSVGGTVAAKREIVTKSGKRMAFVTLEDMGGTIEIVVFPDLYQTVVHHLSSEEPLVAQGTMEKSEDNTAKVLADKIVPLQDAPEKLTKSIRIKINAGMHSEEDVAALHAILSDPFYRGDCTAYIDVVIPGKAVATLRLPSKLSLKPSAELKKRLRDLFGAEVVSYG
jgi:DNA polymerase-3 subunit alpha